MQEAHSLAYYYLCSYPLGSGSTVKCGNWGRISKIKPVGSPEQADFEAIMELVFENVRLREYPKHPSRLESVFVCPNQQSIREFAKHRPLDLMYEVEVIDKDAEAFTTGWNLFDKASCANKSIAEIEQIARSYWNPQNLADNTKELLIRSDIKIIRPL